MKLCLFSTTSKTKAVVASGERFPRPPSQAPARFPRTPSAYWAPQNPCLLYWRHHGHASEPKTSAKNDGLQAGLLPSTTPAVSRPAQRRCGQRGTACRKAQETHWKRWRAHPDGRAGAPGNGFADGAGGGGIDSDDPAQEPSCPPPNFDRRRLAFFREYAVRGATKLGPRGPSGEKKGGRFPSPPAIASWSRGPDLGSIFRTPFCARRRPGNT